MRLAALAFALVLVVALAIPTSREELHWRWVSSIDTPQSYAGYVRSWPGGRHAAEAFRRSDERRWSAAAARNTAESIRGYLDVHPDGLHSHEARERIEEILWRAVSEVDTIAAYAAYLEDRPAGPFSAEARRRQAELREDDSPFRAAVAEGSEEALNAFLEQFPGHRREADARNALRDMQGRDLVDLIGEGVVEVKTAGGGIQNVRLEVRKLVPHPVSVRIPVGTFFVSERRSTQNMVTTASVTRRLITDDWMSISVPAACANRPRDIPGGNDRFRVRRSPQQAELARLVPVLQEARATYGVRQAAVWIVTDDASYSQLGSLVRRTQFQWTGGTRVIQEQEAAEALRLCEQAGIDVTQKRIWRDRHRILRGLDDAGLRAWLAAKG